MSYVVGCPGMMRRALAAPTAPLSTVGVRSEMGLDGQQAMLSAWPGGCWESSKLLTDSVSSVSF